MTFIKIIVVTIILAVGLMFFTLQRNSAHLFEAPGLAERLAVFLKVNSASTSDNPHFEELRTPVFDVPAEKLYQRVLDSGSELGWGIVANDRDEHDANFVVSSPVFLFEDDIFVQVKTISDNQSSLFIQSSSRSGRVDFAANSGHIQLLIKKLRYIK